MIFFLFRFQPMYFVSVHPLNIYNWRQQYYFKCISMSSKISSSLRSSPSIPNSALYIYLQSNLNSYPPLRNGNYLNFQSILFLSAIDNTQIDDILHHLKHISFSRIRVLTLHYNSLQTIEPISHMDMPTLSKLSIVNNRLTSLKQLRKCHLPMICELFYEGNSINDHEYLTQSHSKGLRIIGINTKYVPQDNSLMWLLRMESLGLRKLYVDSYLGFKSSFDKIIKNKYDSVTISIKQ